MNYRVRWSRVAVAALATFWMRATDREAGTRAQAEIDRLLRSDPLVNGTHLSEGLYAISVHPLRAHFEVSTADKRVRIVGLAWLS
jgi:hypothetical protein